MKDSVNILIAGTTDLSYQLIKKILKEKDDSVNIIYEGKKEDYVRELENGEFDLIISDYSIPTFEKGETLRLAKEKKAGIQFIFVTEREEEDEVIEMMSKGANYYILRNKLAEMTGVIEAAIKLAKYEQAMTEIRQDTEANMRTMIQLFDGTKNLIYLKDSNGKLLLANKRVAEFFETGEGEVVKELEEYLKQDTKEVIRIKTFEKRVLKSNTYKKKLVRVLNKRGGTRYHYSHKMAFNYPGYGECLLTIAEDVTEIIEARRKQNLAIGILKILNRTNALSGTIKDIMRRFKTSTGIEAVGIRIKEGEDYPYYTHGGMTKEFVKTENSLCKYDEAGEAIMDAEGKAELACLCGDVISGKIDKTKEYFTRYGSFWTGNALSLEDGFRKVNKEGKYRMRCFREKYETMALIPIRTGEETIGLLQFCDHRKNYLKKVEIEFFEGIAISIGIALSKIKAKKVLEESFNKLFEAQRIGHFGRWEYEFRSGKLSLSEEARKILDIELLKEDTYKTEVITRIKDKLLTELKNEIINSVMIGRNFNRDIKIDLPDMNVRYIHVRGVPEMNKKEIILLKGTIVDITSRKEMEENLIKAKSEAEESDRLKTTFLANISHEVRTPLNGILGFADLLMQKEELDQTSKEYLNIVQSSGHQLLNVFNEILDISLIETGQMKLINKIFNLDELIDEIFEYYKLNTLHTEKNKRCLIIKDGVEFEAIEGKEVNKIELLTDKVRLRQILTHLADNAIKYTEEGRIDIGYEVKDELMLRLYVKDTGIGISKDTQEQVFKYFRQAEDKYTRRYGGLGLGLSLAKKLTELLGGKIILESEERKGTNVYVELPYKKDEKTDVKADIEETEKNKYNWNGKRAVIVEDNYFNFYYLDVLLRKKGMITVHAETGEAVIEICKREKNIDIVLMDIQMQGMDGYEATKIIKRMRKDLPVIAVTAYAMSYDRGKALEVGCDDYLPKPVNKDTLFEIIEKWIMHRAEKMS